MNTKMIAIVVGVIVVLGAGYYFYSKSPTYTDKGNAAANPASQGTGADTSGTYGTSNPGSSGAVSATGKFTGTMAQLASRGGTYKCTFSNSSNGADTSGTVYVSADKIRGDFMTVAAGVPAQSHMLQMGGYMYMWSTITPAGVKLKIGPANPANPVNAQYSAASASYNYDCQGWQADSSVFQIPASVTFTSVN